MRGSQFVDRHFAAQAVAQMRQLINAYPKMSGATGDEDDEQVRLMFDALLRKSATMRDAMSCTYPHAWNKSVSDEYKKKVEG